MSFSNDPALLYLRLREAISETSGLTITERADCALLRELVLIRTKACLSVMTLARFYGFETAKFPPSLFTRNALAEFCGCRSWADFCELNFRDDRPL